MTPAYYYAMCGGVRQHRMVNAISHRDARKYLGAKAKHVHKLDIPSDLHPCALGFELSGMNDIAECLALEGVDILGLGGGFERAVNGIAR